MASGYVYAVGAPVAGYGRFYGQHQVLVSVGVQEDRYAGGEVLRLTDRQELAELIEQLTAAADAWDSAVATDAENERRRSAAWIADNDHSGGA